MLTALAEQGEVKAETVSDAIARYGLDPEAPNPAAVVDFLRRSRTGPWPSAYR